MAERRRPDEAAAPRAPRVGRMFAAYTFLRLAVFVGVLVVLLVVGLGGLAAVLVAIVVSAVISLVAFRSQRAQLAAAMEQRSRARSGPA